MNIMDGREFNRGIDPTENLKKKPRKSILKSSSSFEVQDAPSNSSKRKPAHTKWDEQNIKETLHPPNKDYGHMKIEEPKTPYERLVQDEPDSSRGVDPHQLAEKLNQNLQKNKKHRGGSGSGKSGSASKSRGQPSDSSEDESTDKAKKKEFESRRKLHYNEFLAAKEALKHMKDDDDDEEEE